MPIPSAGANAAGAAVPVGWVSLRAEDNASLAVFLELDDAVPRPSGGYGGFEAQPRDQREAVPVWKGFDVYAVELDVLADNYAAGASIDDVYDTLEALAGRGRQASGDAPPRLIVDAAGVMPHDQHPSPTGDRDTRWVISSLDWSADDNDNLRNAAGNRTRFAATITLWKSPTTVPTAAAVAAVSATVKATKTKRTVTAKGGDTLATIARRYLGDAGRWREIATANGIRDQRAIRGGDKLRIP